MKDIDFEELDRAVSSALQSKDEPTATAIDVNQSEQIESVAENSAPFTPEKKTLLQKRTSGRFMDVVHPSSDMRNQNKPTVSRQAPDIARPEPSSEARPSVDSESHEEDWQQGANIAEVNESEQVPEEDMHTLPDPLDFHNFTGEEGDEVSSEAEVGDVRSNVDASISDEEKGDLLEHDEAHAALEQAASELNELDGLLQNNQEMPPLDTPFVSDLAVEKRPLGAFSIGTGEVEEEVVPVDATMNEAINNALADTSDEDDDTSDERLVDAQVPAEAEVIPEELHEDVVAVESRDLESLQPQPAAVPTAVVTGSIPQQYTEKPSTQSTDTTPVFDTNDYHQPLKHVEKKKSGWLLIVIIFAFIIAGVGAGAAIYFFDPFGLLQ